MAVLLLALLVTPSVVALTPSGCTALRGPCHRHRLPPVVLKDLAERTGGYQGPRKPSEEEMQLVFKEDLSPQEERLLKLELAATFPPRTPPREGEGYIFFQGPTPKTAKQEGLTDFFKQDFGGLAGGASLGAKAAIGLMVALSFSLLVSLIIL